MSWSLSRGRSGSDVTVERSMPSEYLGLSHRAAESGRTAEDWDSVSIARAGVGFDASQVVGFALELVLDDSGTVVKARGHEATHLAIDR
jgi:hypothetical protein